MAKTRDLFNTQKRNVGFTQWPETAMDPLETPAIIVETFLKERIAIDANRHLTPEGKAAARSKARKTSLDTVDMWLSTRLSGLDADLTARRAALVPAADQPDARRIDFLLSHLRDRTPEEIATIYGSATDDERRAMEAAAASVGRVPMKTDNGLQWRPLLDPESVNESILARATAAHPDAVQKWRELAELRDMHLTLAGHAVAEINEG